MFIPIVNSKSNLLYSLIILSSLIIISSPSPNSKRFLQSAPNDNIAQTNNYNSTDDSTSVSEDPGAYLLAWFIIFFFIGAYIVCTMKRYPEISNRTDDVWKFMFFANNGILVASSVNVFNIRNLILDSSPFALSALVFIIGCIYYISKYFQTCSMKVAFHYFECDKLGELYKIPCFMWSLKSLSDDCCRSNSYTVYTYADGHTESNECCHHIWNCAILIIKRLALVFSIVSFYIFLLFYLIFWAIAKLIFMAIMACSKTIIDMETNSPPIEVPPNPVPIDTQNPPSSGREVMINNNPPPQGQYWPYPPQEPPINPQVNMPPPQGQYGPYPPQEPPINPQANNLPQVIEKPPYPNMQTNYQGTNFNIQENPNLNNINDVTNVNYDTNLPQQNEVENMTYMVNKPEYHQENQNIEVNEENKNIENEANNINKQNNNKNGTNDAPAPNTFNN